MSTVASDSNHLDQHGYGTGAGNRDFALRSFFSTYDRFPLRPEYQIVDTMTAAEALLGTRTEITFRLAYRVAGILSTTAAERSEIFQAMRDFYDARSNVVHGTSLRGKELLKQRQALERVDVARDYILRLLLGFLRLAASPSPSYGCSFFKQHLDIALQDEKARRLLAAEFNA